MLHFLDHTYVHMYIYAVFAIHTEHGGIIRSCLVYKFNFIYRTMSIPTPWICTYHSFSIRRTWTKMFSISKNFILVTVWRFLRQQHPFVQFHGISPMSHLEKWGDYKSIIKVWCYFQRTWNINFKKNAYPTR